MRNLNSVILALALSLIANNASATTYYINAPRFVRPLIEKWIAEYKKVYPAADFAIAKTAADKDNSSLNITLSDSQTGEQATDRTVYFAEYAVFPVTAKGSEAARALENDELNKKDVISLFFINEDFVDQKKKKSTRNDDIVVYTGNSNLSVSQQFASYFGKDITSFRGKRIVGDDQFLVNAIAKDSRGVTINTLSNLFDLQTRRLKDDLTFVPLDVDKSLRAAIAEGNSLDNIIEVLETGNTDGIPIGKIGLNFREGDRDLAGFVSWILTDGRDFNHQYGLLKIDDKLAEQQARELTHSRLTAQK